MEQSVHFRHGTEKVLKQQHFGRDAPRELDVLGFIVEEQSLRTEVEVWVAGIVVKNPFFTADRSRDERIEDGDLTTYLSRTEALVCELGSWHLLEDLDMSYLLRQCEWDWTSDALVVRMSADWDR